MDLAGRASAWIAGIVTFGAWLGLELYPCPRD